MAPERFFLELEPPLESLRQRPHVVIVGGGFAGLAACRALAGADLRVTLIDRRNFNLFQPLLYQVSTGLISPSDVASPLRLLVGRQANLQVLLGEVDHLDVDRRRIGFEGSDFAYDHLILAAGSGSTYFGHPEWAELAPSMKTLEDAEEIRRRLLLVMEEAERTPDSERRRHLQAVVIVGGGPTGCELAGSVSDLMRHSLERDFKQLDPADTTITLVDPGDRLLRALDPQLSAAAAQALEAAGVRLLLGGRVRTIEAGRLSVTSAEGEQVLEAATICWTAGVRASPLGGELARASSCRLDRGGRVEVEPDFSIPGHPEIRVIGDLCAYAHTPDGRPLPGMAAPAVQMGAWVARDLRGRLEGWTPKPFRFFDPGSMAVLGPGRAVADLRGLTFSGPLAWLLWGLAHLAFMPDPENRLLLLLKWLWVIGTRQRSALVIGQPQAPAAVTEP
ncbi:NAD(P)/FAD-dependent oxidoreductase [Cyanobium sp. Morenito 9A2]|uniref:NAD(P)/FAD-dependent oxidoreductase n=1 Tax=Cyanobium sp. Morenito 9A2 TaxID=2823718 RepID=UPI0020CCB239|nr:NAD(P)/FAD-dependent oxidoreductase [Cyanobium sp. Morenito 9A2]MCP9849429.1 NAD(P)/FAD-dependent oxidoreductase [Cyanobium sp. Morenito 9A2]